MNQTLYSRVRIRAVLLFIGGTALAGAATAQSGDREPADRDALKLKLQEMDISPEQIDEPASRRAEFMRGADANTDGVLTMVELELALEAGFARIDRNADGLVGLGDAPRLAGRDRFLSRVTPMIAERDANGDGSMSFAEFSEPPLSKFSLMDEDGDGQVNLDAIVDAANAGSASEDT
tara:strand:- start:30815 stop:31348 length:534 start_codon:yes stop_codon:yes gene_type:complete